ncbi:uncharacterized protein BXZ73DRAFT_49977, partial [Epithele typhae]|uniref:uncharacterized protein n=1 Tax=Epithele typhae TaxID=378194 RepID=UPI00200739F2
TMHPVKSAAVRTPRMASPPSRSSFESAVDETGSELAPTPQNHSTAKKHALFRDGCRCMLTGKYDVDLMKQYPDKFPFELITSTRCVHIIPEQTLILLADGLAKGFWAVLARFGYPTAWIELNGRNCHRLCNLLTLSLNAHEEMGTLDLWFESTSTLNTYDVKTHPPLLRKAYDWPAQGGLDLPDPDYLALHAACCKIAHMAGAAKAVKDSIIYGPESYCVLAQDGSSADLLFDELSWLVYRVNAPPVPSHLLTQHAIFGYLIKPSRLPIVDEDDVHVPFIVWTAADKASTVCEPLVVYAHRNDLCEVNRASEHQHRLRPMSAQASQRRASYSFRKIPSV